ncbi:BTB/POZ domain and ankyrin repeat-containing protein NPR1 [Prunus avium]|uniref:BTB/POZ domain and ankyrin repeat-containing protein NPR1 n=1 Tax=Prunus avium TaxID=42229 RepID=A0A6P5RTA4_PRUAV|nr:BTB/POZ domain and ankyrin repeat-containing protein NPR1 [Prunus avium]
MEFKAGVSVSNDVVSNSNCYSNSNSSTISCIALSHYPSPPDISALTRLSDNLESILDSADFDFFADAKIVVNTGREVPVHRCILSARSSFFKNVFSAKDIGSGSAVRFELKELAKEYDVGLDSLLAVLGYLYSGKLRSLPKGVCACVDDACAHVSCRPVVDFIVEVLYASATFEISELVSLYQRHLLDILEKVCIDDILVVLYVANMCGKACERLVGRCVEIIVKSDADVVTLEKALPQHTVKLITDSRLALGLDRPQCNTSVSHFPDKHTKRIHRALDSDDVELVRMLLKEAHANLDDAYALHYAVAYCDAKTTTELLDLGLADVNCRNLRGYTVLHVAAMRKEPKIIVSLLTKGARPSDLTLDGRKAIQITKRLTRAADFFKSNDEGKSSSNDRLCIEILEQAERRDPLLGEASLSLAMAGDDLRMKLLYLENRVGLAKYLFPMEAKVVMDISQIDGASEFPIGGISSKDLASSKRTTVDLNEAPFKIKEEHLLRLQALSRTVELGKRFFPRCSEVLNKIMDGDDISQLAYTGDDTPELRLWKRRRYMELQEVLSKAFNEDKEEFDRSAMSSSSSSTSIGVVRSNGKLTLNQ